MQHSSALANVSQLAHAANRDYSSGMNKLNRDSSLPPLNDRHKTELVSRRENTPEPLGPRKYSAELIREHNVHGAAYNLTPNKSQNNI